MRCDARLGGTEEGGLPQMRPSTIKRREKKNKESLAIKVNLPLGNQCKRGNTSEKERTGAEISLADPPKSTEKRADRSPQNRKNRKERANTMVSNLYIKILGGGQDALKTSGGMGIMTEKDTKKKKKRGIRPN